MARVAFLVGGVQKGGTTALANYLSAHPALVLPRGKEAHVFDAPDFPARAGPDEIDALYAAHFDMPAPDRRLHGDATPIYCFHPAFVDRIADYNPDMRWILVLRHPVERAVSQYWMERGRGHERWPLWAAMAFERLRLRGHEDDFSPCSPLRRHSYRARGDYARQLDAILARFPAHQLLVMRSEELAARPQQAMAGVWSFLGVEPPGAALAARNDFPGNYRALRRGGAGWRAMCRLMRRELLDARRHGIAW